MCVDTELRVLSRLVLFDSSIGVVLDGKDASFRDRAFVRTVRDVDGLRIGISGEGNETDRVSRVRRTLGRRNGDARTDRDVSVLRVVRLLRVRNRRLGVGVGDVSSNGALARNTIGISHASSGGTQLRDFARNRAASVLDGAEIQFDAGHRRSHVVTHETLSEDSLRDGRTDLRVKSVRVFEIELERRVGCVSVWIRLRMRSSPRTVCVWNERLHGRRLSLHDPVYGMARTHSGTRVLSTSRTQSD